MLFKKMLRDMRQNLSQFIAIFLMSVLGVAVFAGINAEWNGMKYERDRYYEENRLRSLAHGRGFLRGRPDEGI